jgi:hypothetical protein
VGGSGTFEALEVFEARDELAAEVAGVAVLAAGVGVGGGADLSLTDCLPGADLARGRGIVIFASIEPLFPADGRGEPPGVIDWRGVFETAARAAIALNIARASRADGFGSFTTPEVARLEKSPLDLLVSSSALAIALASENPTVKAYGHIVQVTYLSEKKRDPHSAQSCHSQIDLQRNLDH